MKNEEQRMKLHHALPVVTKVIKTKMFDGMVFDFSGKQSWTRKELIAAAAVGVGVGVVAHNVWDKIFGTQGQAIKDRDSKASQVEIKQDEGNTVLRKLWSGVKILGSFAAGARVLFLGHGFTVAKREAKEAEAKMTAAETIAETAVKQQITAAENAKQAERERERKHK